jgi:hypothetical protein
LAWCANESAHPTADWSQLCLQMCRVAWGIPTPMFRDAYAAWQGSNQQFDTPPPGAPIYWDHILVGGVPRRELGHVAIADSEPGWCWSIDILRSHPGRVDRVPIDLIRTKWGGHYLGWTSDLEGVTLPLGPTTIGSVGMIPADTKGYDAAFPPSPAACAGDGGRFMMRYYAPVLATNAKNMKPGEPMQWAQAGIAVGINGEWSAATMLGGTSSNTTLGKAVRQGCDRDGVPDTVPIWWSMDTQCDPPQYDASRFAWDAYRATNPNNPFGVYGGSQYCEWCVQEGYADLIWMANAPYWSRVIGSRDGEADNETTFRFPHDTNQPFQFNYYVSPLTNVRQIGGKTIDGAAVDINTALLDTPFWFPGQDLPPSEDDLTGPEHDALMTIQDFVGHIFNGLFLPVEGTSDPAMQWCSILTYDRLAKDDRYVNQIAAAVVAALPPGQSGGNTQKELVDAFILAMTQMQGKSVTLFEGP